MGMTASVGGSGEFTQCPVGLHPARCFRLIDIGTQPDDKYPEKHQVLIGFEVPGEQITYMRDGEEVSAPQSVTQFVTLSMHEKSNLRKIIHTWFGRVLTDDEAAKFDLTTILGNTAYINVMHRPSGKAYIDGIMQLPKGLEIAEQYNESQYYSIEEHGLNWPDCISEKMRDWISKSYEIKALKQDATVRSAANIDPKDVPF